jgi:hypothetical protein
MRHQLDLSYRIENQSIEIFSVRPHWKNPDEVMEESHAKTTFVKTKGIWNVFWKRADLKWHTYTPAPRVRFFEDFLALVLQDEKNCFFG